jgi:hypothetical protein
LIAWKPGRNAWIVVLDDLRGALRWSRWPLADHGVLAESNGEDDDLGIAPRHPLTYEGVRRWLSIQR